MVACCLPDGERRCQIPEFSFDKVTERTSVETHTEGVNRPFLQVWLGKAPCPRIEIIEGSNIFVRSFFSKPFRPKEVIEYLIGRKSPADIMLWKVCSAVLRYQLLSSSMS
ncbi:MAG: hypothetical protein ACI9R3_003099 [Verrucomicrobiales bacterium]|jgi:hypothetical protein